MATIFTHALVGCTIVATMTKEYRTRVIYATGAVTAIVPDFDYLGYVAHVPYESLWGHRGMTHSIAFAIVLGIFMAVLISRKLDMKALMLSFLFFCTTISHGLLDACTSGGLGVAFYAPYNSIRYFLPWRPIRVSPMGLGFFSERGLVVLFSELVWIVAPCAVILFFAFFLRRKNR